MPPAAFEPIIPASERPQTYALDRAATEIGVCTICERILCLKRNVLIKREMWAGTSWRLRHLRFPRLWWGIQVFWALALSIRVFDSRRFGGTYRLHLQGSRQHHCCSSALLPENLNPQHCVSLDYYYYYFIIGCGGRSSTSSSMHAQLKIDKKAVLVPTNNALTSTWVGLILYSQAAGLTLPTPELGFWTEMYAMLEQH